MKIIFLNTFHGNLAKELRSYIQKHLSTTDVFCFQEAPLESRDAYKDLLSDFDRHEAHKGEPIGDRYGNVTYVRKTIPIIETETLFEVDEDGFELGLTTLLTLQINGRQLIVANVHGIPTPGHKLDTPSRIYQSETILDSVAGKKAVIIGGDFNLLPQTESVQTFAAHGYRNLISDFAIATTRNRLTFERYPDTIQYYADYAFTSPEIEVVDFVVPDDVVSDHQPLELIFEIVQ